LGLDQSSEAKDRSDNLAKMVPEIDLVVDGHSHTVLPNGLEVNGNYVVQTGEYDKN
jgi:2',3'-cyclic-nucleotide 2'-phosphodiesterase (5'-nucleotidase family)